jgi:hypothetical protein
MEWVLRISLGLSSETMWDPLRLSKRLFRTNLEVDTLKGYWGIFRPTSKDYLGPLSAYLGGLFRTILGLFMRILWNSSRATWRWEYTDTKILVNFSLI